MFAGGNYANLGIVQKSRRRKQIERAILQYTSSLSAIGLKVVGISLLQTTTQTVITLQLFPNIRVLKEREAINESDNIIPQVSQLLLHFGVSEECYHEITQIIGGPKSYKVKWCVRACMCACTLFSVLLYYFMISIY